MQREHFDFFGSSALFLFGYAEGDRQNQTSTIQFLPVRLFEEAFFSHFLHISFAASFGEIRLTNA